MTEIRLSLYRQSQYWWYNMEGVIVHDKINRKYAINFVLLKLCFRESRLWIWLNKYKRYKRYKPHAIGLWVIIKYIILQIYFINAKIDENAGHHTAHIDMFDSRILGGNLKSKSAKIALTRNISQMTLFSKMFDTLANIDLLDSLRKMMERLTFWLVDNMCSLIFLNLIISSLFLNRILLISHS